MRLGRGRSGEGEGTGGDGVVLRELDGRRTCFFTGGLHRGPWLGFGGFRGWVDVPGQGVAAVDVRDLLIHDWLWAGS